MKEDIEANSKRNEITLVDLVVKISEIYRYLKARKLIILICCVLGGAVGLTYALLRKPTYNAMLSFALEDDKGSGSALGGAIGLASQFGFDLGGSGGGAFSGDNLLELMRSRTMVESSLLNTLQINGKKETLADLYISVNQLYDRWGDKPELKNIKFSPDTDRTRFTLQQDSILMLVYNDVIKKSLSVEKTDKKLSIITINVNSKSELFSKKFTEVLVTTVSTFFVKTKTKRSAQNVNILQHQTDSVRRELNAAISGVASSADINPNPNSSLQILRVPSLRRQVDVQANTAILGELVKNLEISKITLRKETPLIQIIDRPILPLEKKKTSKAISILIGGLSAFILSVAFILIKRSWKKLSYRAFHK